MKKLLYIIVALLSFIVFTSCEDEYEKDVEACIRWNAAIDKEIERLSSFEKMDHATMKRIINLYGLKCDLE